ncbi:Haloacid Dehalogenase Superfamily Class (subfamily) IIA/haloacid dehalogenase superfamily, subfamily IA, variant 1 with third motif having Dx(3-4)D or Dx(3-4)E [Devosia sp. YR412]|uniref:HAD-IIA family hydrolase n=1 Tax=Devosia sp. YR412 TaxID=1881030 RepID=UPI0008C49556|nr:HAD-IA family hydrolase [Devosia sp. YR412]SEP64072.1 Haloacid Dehalogenase Superfamily Class (subfamily) IIA/haloacid dehalogenase superfamily, subfamily IA, variant 1 with third motif having Dx(3-4)D or Dx(3-4)E [Devosia sp. YR412]
MSFNFAAHRGFLIDLDGTLASGLHLLPGARDLLAATADRFAIVSNDSEHTPDQLARRFREWRLPLPPERIVLAGVTALEAAAERYPGSRLVLLGSPALRRMARNMGFELVERNAQVVIVARDRQFTYAKLAMAARAVRDGADVLVAAPDLSHPGADGYLVPEAGALAAALFAVTGPVPHRVIGKPQPELFRHACRSIGIAPEHCVVIGDNPRTDGAGASGLGVPFWQVVPGKLPDLLRETVTTEI